MIFNVWTTEHILTRFLKDGLDRLIYLSSAKDDIYSIQIRIKLCVFPSTHEIIHRNDSEGLLYVSYKFFFSHLPVNFCPNLSLGCLKIDHSSSTECSPM